MSPNHLRRGDESSGCFHPAQLDPPEEGNQQERRDFWDDRGTRGQEAEPGSLTGEAQRKTRGQPALDHGTRGRRPGPSYATVLVGESALPPGFIPPHSPNAKENPLLPNEAERSPALASEGDRWI